MRSVHRDGPLAPAPPLATLRSITSPKFDASQRNATVGRAQIVDVKNREVDREADRRTKGRIRVGKSLVVRRCCGKELRGADACPAGGHQTQVKSGVSPQRQGCGFVVSCG